MKGDSFALLFLLSRVRCTFRWVNKASTAERRRLADEPLSNQKRAKAFVSSVATASGHFSGTGKIGGAGDIKVGSNSRSQFLSSRSQSWFSTWRVWPPIATISPHAEFWQTSRPEKRSTIHSGSQASCWCASAEGPVSSCLSVSLRATRLPLAQAGQGQLGSLAKGGFQILRLIGMPTFTNQRLATERWHYQDGSTSSQAR